MGMTIQRKFVVLLGAVALSVALGFTSVLWTVFIFQSEILQPYRRTNQALEQVSALNTVLAEAERVVETAQDPPPGLAQTIRDASHRMLISEPSAPGVGVGGLRALEAAALEAADALEHLDPAANDSRARAGRAVTRASMILNRIGSQILGDSAQSVGHDRTLKTDLYLVTGASLAVALLISILGILLVRRWILLPIDRLRQAAERIGQNDYAYRIPGAHGRDELSRLSDTVNRMAEQIAESRRREVERERLAAAGAMVRRLAHNIRNPLAGIRSLAELTRDDLPPGSETRQMQERIISAIDRFELWLADLLRNASNPRYAPTRHQVRPWLCDVIKPHQPLALARGVEIHLDETGAPEQAVFDGGHLEHALAAVLFNAIEASESGGRIFIRAETNGAGWRVRVRDEGPGVPAEHAADIFRPDFTTKPSGHGLGLPAAASALAAHGGRLSLACPEGPDEGSKVRGPGAEFIFDLPHHPSMMEPVADTDEP